MSGPIAICSPALARTVSLTGPGETTPADPAGGGEPDEESKGTTAAAEVPVGSTAGMSNGAGAMPPALLARSDPSPGEGEREKLLRSGAYGAPAFSPEGGTTLTTIVSAPGG